MPESETITADEGILMGSDFFKDGQSNSDSVGGFWASDMEDGMSNGDQEANLESMLGQKNNSTNSAASVIDWNPFKSERVLGLPLYYNPLADPSGRVYNETIITDIPQVYFIPGEPQMNRNLIDVAGNRIIPATLSRMIMEFENNPTMGFSFGVRGLKTGNDLRFIGFKENYAEYFKYVQVMLSTIWSYLDSAKMFEFFRFSDVFSQDLKNYGLCFYGDKATTVSESADNTYSPSATAEAANQNAQSMRESKMVSPTKTTASTILQSIRDMNPLAILDSLQTFDGVINRTANALFRVANGSELDFPDMWDDSKFDKSYNLSFKFYSPYGDKLSIFRNVYVPYIALLCLALP